MLLYDCQFTQEYKGPLVNMKMEGEDRALLSEFRIRLAKENIDVLPGI